MAADSTDCLQADGGMDSTDYLASIGLELRDDAAKGFGVFARVAFSAGQRLLAEEPLVECEACDARGTVYPAATVDALDASVRAHFFALCQNEQWGAEKTARGIWLSNALPTDDLPTPKSAVFRYTCRFNHACRPNVYQHWNERLRAMTLHAIRPIRSGEELTISYLPFGDGAPRSSRQASLHGDFGFRCGCDLCELQGDALKQSDARQERIQALGRRLGFPTANLDLFHELEPPTGVYACRAHIVPPPAADGAPDPRERTGTHDAVANIGHRPTVVAAPGGTLVEVHLLDFEGDLYGQRIELEFVERIRGEQRFDGLDALSAAIASDVESARRILD